MHLRITSSVQLVWTGLFALLVIPRAVDVQSSSSLINGILAVILVALAVGCFRGHALCWGPVAVIGILIVSKWLPMVAHNIYLMYWTDDPLFHESPGTGVVVLLYGAFFVVSPIAIAFLFCVEMFVLKWMDRVQSANDSCPQG